MTYVSIDPECAGVLLQLDGADVGKAAGRLDVRPLRTDRQTNQVLLDTELSHARRPAMETRALSDTHGAR